MKPEAAFKSALFGLLGHHPTILKMHIKPAMYANGRIMTPIEGDSGWPDMVLCGPGGLLLRELKAEKGRVSPEQQRWLSVLRSAGADAGVWRPEQLRDGTVERELRGLR